MNRFLRNGFAVFLAVFFLSLPCALAAQGPLDAVTTAQKAIDSSDATLFNKVVNVDSILDKGAASALDILTQKMRNGELVGVNPVLALTLSSMGQDPMKIEMLRGLLGAEIKKFVAAGINGGYFAGKPNGKGDGGAFSGLLQGLSREKKELVPGRVLSEKGDAATISATLVDYGAGKFPLELGLIQENGLWRITEVLNIRALLDSALQQGGNRP